jgi:hypothetical protein
VVDLLESARRTSARAVNAVMTAAYWEIGRRIVECEQAGKGQAEYGAVLVTRLAVDLSERFGRGFGKSNLYQMRSFYLAYADIFQTVSGKLGATNPAGPSSSTAMADKVLAAEYRMALPDEKTLAAELQRTQAALEQRAAGHSRGLRRKADRP